MGCARAGSSTAKPTPYHASHPRRGVQCSVLNLTATNVTWQYRINHTEVATVDSPVAGSVTIVSSDNGTVSSAAATGVGGACNVTACSPAVGALFAANQQVVCNFTCQTAVTSVTPAVNVTFWGATAPTRLNTTAASVTINLVPGGDACVDAYAPLLNTHAPSHWPTEPRVFCFNTTAPNLVGGSATVTTATAITPPAYPGDCPFAAASYPFNLTMRLSPKGGAPDATSTALAAVQCPQPAFTGEAATMTTLQGWSWGAAVTVTSQSASSITWGLVRKFS